MSFLTISALLLSIITASVAQIFLKKGVSTLGDSSFSLSNLFNLISGILRNGWLLGGTLLFVISFLFYLFVLSKLRLNLAYPVMVSAGMILVAIGSWIFLGEYLSWRQIMGIILIIFGIFLLLPRI